jgi:hypothetical protein
MTVTTVSRLSTSSILKEEKPSQVHWQMLTVDGRDNGRKKNLPWLITWSPHLTKDSYTRFLHTNDMMKPERTAHRINYDM